MSSFAQCFLDSAGKVEMAALALTASLQLGGTATAAFTGTPC